MEILKIVGLAIITIVATIIVKQIKPEFAIFITLSGCAIILMYALNLFGQVIDMFNYIFEKTNIDKEMFTILLKIIGIGYITEFSCGLCEDSGNSAIAQKIQLVGKLLIFTLAIPIVTDLIDLIVGLMS